MDSDSTTVIEVTVAAPLWRRAVAEPESLCSRAAHAALAAASAHAALAAASAGVAGPVEASILLTDDAAVRGLNRAWRGQDKPTNVLSFPAGDEPALAGAPRLLGDVVVALETVEREAAAAGLSCADHLAHMVVHGILHLVGHDHLDEADAAFMERLEARVLGGLGIVDPYLEMAP